MSIDLKFLASLILAGLLLSSCSIPIKHQDSGMNIPTSWNQTPVTVHGPLDESPDAQIDHGWWKHFDDATLNELINEALTNNKTLKIAQERVREARAVHGGVESNLFPQVSGVASEQHGNQGFATNNENLDITQLDVQATWELDLFGGQQARTAEAKAIEQSTEASRRAVRVGLLAEVARNYFDLRNYERQIALTRQNLQDEKDTLDLIKVQFDGALASDFDVQRAAAQVSSTEALIPALQTDYDMSMNRLNVLLGYPPGTKDVLLQTPEAMKPLDPHILIAAPAKVLASRPDVLVAERRFAATVSAKAAATSDLFPDISLTGLFGALTAPFTATPLFGGAALTLPILNFGKVQSEIDAADSRQKQAFLNYQQTVLEALENMENALSSYQHETTRNVSLANAVSENQKAADLAQQQYTNGYSSLLDVLIAQRDLLDAESKQAASDMGLRKDLTNIYAAAGGGWEEMQPKDSAKTE